MDFSGLLTRDITGFVIDGVATLRGLLKVLPANSAALWTLVAGAAYQQSAGIHRLRVQIAGVKGKEADG
jgi:hypothetical protein